MGEFKDLTGQRFGKLTVIKRDGTSKKGHVIWLCECECGENKHVISSHLSNGTVKSCGCLRGYNRIQDLTGQKFGMLEVVEFSMMDGHSHALYKCKCECGTEKNIRADHLLSGRSTNCGCQRPNDLTGKRFGRLLVLHRIGSKTYGKENNQKSSTWFCKCDCGKELSLSNMLLTKKNGTKSCGCLNKDVHKLPEYEASINQIYRNYKKQADKRNYIFSLTKEEFKNIILQNCYYCGAPPKNKYMGDKFNGNLIYNGVDRIDNTKGYTLDNVRPCCKHCNWSKKDLTEIEFYEWVNAVHATYVTKIQAF